MRFQTRLVVLASLVALPGIIAAMTLLWWSDLSMQVRIAVTAFVLGATLLLLAILQDRVLFSLRTMSNLIGALREGDFSLRARRENADDALGELAVEINRLGMTLRDRRHDDIEADALVKAIVAQLDAAVFAFDHDAHLRLVNRAGEQLLSSSSRELVGHAASDLGIAALLEKSYPAAVEMRFPGAEGRWSIRQSAFYSKGKAHRLLVIADLSRALRDEELLAWQRLVRVIGHELNNSLAPIKAVATGLQTIFGRDTLPADWRDDLDEGLSIIANRAEALTRFTQGYARLARLPRPVLAPVRVSAIVNRVASLSYARPVSVVPAEDEVVLCDGDQIEQVLINLIQNGVDAASETGGDVTVTWRAHEEGVELSVLDTGPGLTASANLFVPFFTTKPGGAGIGLVLARQIAEAHGGRLSLHAREDRRGCEARLFLARTIRRGRIAQSAR